MTPPFPHDRDDVPPLLGLHSSDALQRNMGQLEERSCGWGGEGMLASPWLVQALPITGDRQGPHRPTSWSASLGAVFPLMSMMLSSMCLSRQREALSGSRQGAGSVS